VWEYMYENENIYENEEQKKAESRGKRKIKN